MAIGVKFSLLLAVLPLVTCLEEPFKHSLQSFSHNLFHELKQSHGHDNIIYSPFSIQTCLSMARMGAAGETASQMDNGLSYDGLSSEMVANNFHILLSKHANSSVLNLANKLFVSQDLELHGNFNDILNSQFISPIEKLDFSQKSQAAGIVNNWVASKTNNAIHDIINADEMDENTQMMLLSAIHFKGDWAKQFNADFTKEYDFYVDETTSVKVPMMHMTSVYETGQIPQLNAQVLRLLYRDSDLSMLIFLPNSRTGLASMEESLKTFDLSNLSKSIARDYVDLLLPKFKVQFKIDLKEPLKKLGMTDMFENNADFSKMTTKPLKVSRVLHMALIDVSEKGTEAAAATVLEAIPKSLIPPMEINHPFHYMIVDSDNTVIFEGNVVKF